MIGVSWHDHRTNEWVRCKTMVRDIMHVIKARKLSWASHIARIKDNRWTSQVSGWRPMDGSRSTGRPSNRWRDEINDFWRCVTWKQNAQQLDWQRLNIMIWWWWWCFLMSLKSGNQIRGKLVQYLNTGFNQYSVACVHNLPCPKHISCLCMVRFQQKSLPL